MAPFREYPAWNQRASDGLQQFEPLKRYVIICEGANTEKAYFESLIDAKKELGFNPQIEIIFLEKIGDDANLSAPKRLLEKANYFLIKQSGNFDKSRDRCVLVFDIDRFCNKQYEYSSIITEGKRKNFILAVTNPNFELFLLLHRPNSYQEIIKPHEKELIAPKRTEERHCSSRLFSDVFGMNPKTNPNVGELAWKVDIAIEEEKNLNQDIKDCFKKVTSNIGAVLETIRNEKIL